METVYRDYAPRDVKFYYIYKSLAHPETNGYITPFSLEERLMHVREAQQKLGSQITWLADAMDNRLKHALGDAPNSQFLVDPEGTIVRRWQWSDPQALRNALAERIGPVEHPTTIDQLQIEPLVPRQTARRHVVPRVRRAGAMQALVLEPQPSDEPFYAKLRAEVDDRFFRSGEGSLYLGFHLDPLYDVHWNNLVDPIQFDVIVPAGVTVTPADGRGPKVEEPADADPREFLLTITAEHRDQPLRVVVQYYACHDEEGWCKRIRQEYVVKFERDPDGGSVRMRPRPGADIGSRQPQARRPATPGQQPRQRVAGTVVRVHGPDRQLVIRTMGGDERQLSVGPDAQIRRNGQPATLDDIQPDDRVMVGVRPDEADVIVMRIMARG